MPIAKADNPNRRPAILAEIWQDAIVVIDANALLDIYRIHHSQSKQLLVFMESIEEKLWIPDQICEEFNRGEEIVIKACLNSSNEVTTLLGNVEKQIRGLKHPWTKSNELADIVAGAKSDIENLLSAHQSSFAQGKKASQQIKDNCQDFGQKLRDLYAGKVGKPFSTKEKLETIRLIETRYTYSMPPGYKDKHKPDPWLASGDAVVWYQMLSHAFTQQKPMIFVTEDSKSDWWKSAGEFRPELIEEFAEETSHRICAYNWRDFYSEAIALLRRTPSVKLTEVLSQLAVQQASDLVLDRLKMKIRLNQINYEVRFEMAKLFNRSYPNLLNENDAATQARLLVMTGTFRYDFAEEITHVLSGITLALHDNYSEPIIDMHMIANNAYAILNQIQMTSRLLGLE